MPHQRIAGGLIVLVLIAFTAATALDELSIGASAPMTDVEMTGTSDEVLSLEEAAGENGLLVVFSSNTCPWVKAWEDRYLTAAKLADELGIGMVAINSNAAARDRGESLADMKARAEAQGYDFPYVVDEGAKLAEAFGATHTPHIYLFNADMELVYRGAIDDNARQPEAVEETYLADAMRALVNGEEISPQTTKSIGCTIKFPS